MCGLSVSPVQFAVQNFDISEVGSQLGMKNRFDISGFVKYLALIYPAIYFAVQTRILAGGKNALIYFDKTDFEFDISGTVNHTSIHAICCSPYEYDVWSTIFLIS